MEILDQGAFAMSAREPGILAKDRFQSAIACPL